MVDGEQTLYWRKNPEIHEWGSVDIIRTRLRLEPFHSNEYIPATYYEQSKSLVKYY